MVICNAWLNFTIFVDRVQEKLLTEKQSIIFQFTRY
jgi:hypothetical protein